MVKIMSMPKGIDPKLTESYLMNLVGVVDVSVWWQDEALHAYVTAIDDSVFSARDYQNCCMQDLGLHQTPRNITIGLRRDRSLAA
jgi:hypothetical protein